MLDMQVFWSKHKVNKREIEPEADLANVTYELSSKDGFILAKSALTIAIKKMFSGFQNKVMQ